MNPHKEFAVDCALCRLENLSHKSFRYQIYGRFNSKAISEELGKAATLEKAEELIDAFRKWPAIDSATLKIVTVDNEILRRKKE